MTAQRLHPTRDRINELLTYEPETGAFRWRVRRGPSALAGAVAGSVNVAGYINVCIDGHQLYAHAIVWFMETGEWLKGIDHRDTDKANNRFSNLRPADKKQNGQNRSAPRHNTSGFKGVTWAKREQRWRASIQVNKSPISLGYFRDINDAAEAYRVACLRYHGEYANTSGPQHLEKPPAS